MIPELRYQMVLVLMLLSYIVVVIGFFTGSFTLVNIFCGVGIGLGSALIIIDAPARIHNLPPTEGPT